MHHAHRKDWKGWESHKFLSSRNSHFLSISPKCVEASPSPKNLESLKSATSKIIDSNENQLRKK
jgi:hypothetical protein